MLTGVELMDEGPEYSGMSSKVPLVEKLELVARPRSKGKEPAPLLCVAEDPVIADEDVESRS